MSKPYQVVRDLEAAICEYTGAPYCVTTNSCTMAILLACAWHRSLIKPDAKGVSTIPRVMIPKRTYISVPMSIRHAGFQVGFREEDWSGIYRLDPLPVFDSARWFSGGMYGGGKAMFSTEPGSMVACSFHAAKILADTQGGCVLHDNPEADAWLRRARFDGRTEGVAPKDDTFTQLGWHCYMSPDVAARLLLKLSVLPRHNDPLPNDDYPELDKMEIFK